MNEVSGVVVVAEEVEEGLTLIAVLLEIHGLHRLGAVGRGIEMIIVLHPLGGKLTPTFQVIEVDVILMIEDAIRPVSHVAAPVHALSRPQEEDGRIRMNPNPVVAIHQADLQHL